MEIKTTFFLTSCAHTHHCSLYLMPYRRRKSYVPDSIPPKEIVRKFKVALKPVELYSRYRDSDGVTVMPDGRRLNGFCSFPNTPVHGSSKHLSATSGSQPNGLDFWMGTAGFNRGFVSYYKSKATINYFGTNFDSLDFMSWLDTTSVSLRPLPSYGSTASMTPATITPTTADLTPWQFRTVPGVISKSVKNANIANQTTTLRRRVNMLKTLGLDSIDDAFQEGANADLYTFSLSGAGNFEMREWYAVADRYKDQFISQRGVTTPGHLAKEYVGPDGTTDPFIQNQVPRIQLTITYWIHMRSTQSKLLYVD